MDNAGYSKKDKQPVYDIEGELRLARRKENADLYLFRHKFGEGKTTYGLCCLEEGDVFLSQTQSQNKENWKHFNKLRPNTSTIRIFGWDFLIGYKLDKEEKKLLPQKIRGTEPEEAYRQGWAKKGLWHQERKAVETLRKLTEKKDTRAEARREYKLRYGNKPRILDKWKEQFSKKTWKKNVIFACNVRIREIRHRAYLKSTNKIMVDEGVEQEFIKEKLCKIKRLQEILCCNNIHLPTVDTGSTEKQKKREELSKKYLNLLKPNKNDIEICRDIREAIKSYVDYSYPDLQIIEKSEIEKLLSLTRKIMLHIYSNTVRKNSKKESYALGLTDYVRFEGGKTENNSVKLLDEFEKIWKNIAKEKQSWKDFYGTAFRQEYRKQIQRDDVDIDTKLEVIKELQQIQNLCKKIWEARNCKLYYERNNNTQDIEELLLKKPLMYELWDIVNKSNHAEIWILDATSGKEYLNRTLREQYGYYRYNNYDYLPRPQKNSVYLGEGEKYDLKDEKIVLEDRSYSSIQLEDLETDYKRYKIEYNKEKDKDSVSRSVLWNKSSETPTRLGEELIQMLKRENDKKNIGVITYKPFAEYLLERNISATWYGQAEGTNNFKNVEDLYVIGSPRTRNQDQYKNYLHQYRQIPEYLPQKLSSMRVTNKSGSLVEYIDRVDELELVEKGLIEPESGLGHKNTFTYWKDYWQRNIENPVFDAYFRKRNQYKNIGTVTRIGIDVKNFIGEAEGTASELLNEKMTDRELVENWEKVSAPKVYKDRKVVVKEGNSYRLEKSFRKWKEVGYDENLTNRENAKRLGISERNLRRWKKRWRSIGLIPDI